MPAYTALCAFLARWCLRLAALSLVLLVVCVQWQVIGRYLLNDTPVWTEPVALLLVLYITALAVAVGVRDAGHLGLESLVALLPTPLRRCAEALIQGFVALFAALMAAGGWEWMQLKWDEPKPILGVPEALDYLPLLVGGGLILLFCIEHLIALWRKDTVEPAGI